MAGIFFNAAYNIECAAIYGAGDYGKTLIDYLISAGEEEKILGIIVTKRKDADRNYSPALLFSDSKRQPQRNHTPNPRLLPVTSPDTPSADSIGDGAVY